VDFTDHRINLEYNSHHTVNRPKINPLAACYTGFIHVALLM
jgi:hypothetical protein